MTPLYPHLAQDRDKLTWGIRVGLFSYLQDCRKRPGHVWGQKRKVLEGAGSDPWHPASSAPSHPHSQAAVSMVVGRGQCTLPFLNLRNAVAQLPRDEIKKKKTPPKNPDGRSRIF